MSAKRPEDWDKQDNMEDTLRLWMKWVYRDLIQKQLDPNTTRIKVTDDE